ncbi:hypothetical protein HGP14_30845 [Rhizobium sp. P32RR-XVIII]|uniref:hypothetical protein n=1 Tax=Rhizobium sp. P32RR-XVIII TaxID=2726738 RepID=UPI001456EA3E|nr:hypothetical protein [Rhizobium sp. P32RR-XVIII]NLS07660.1 hypothetical protein [Rhizobium sp. P32RR-XVIII]
MAKARRPRNGRKATSKTALPGSLGEVLDSAGFTSLGRRIMVGGPKRGDEERRPTVAPQPEASSGRFERPTAPAWTAPVIEFLADNIPGDPSVAWDHLYISAYEVGCEALEALGQATQIVSGAIPLADQAIPDVLPRWDDLATAVVGVAAQSNLLGYRHFAGSRRQLSRAGRFRPNIRASHGCGPAYLAPEAFNAFRNLGLIIDGWWTEAAEAVFWRDDPVEWGMDFTRDDRFLAACSSALSNLPADIAAEIETIALVTDDEVSERYALEVQHRPQPRTKGEIRVLLENHHRYDLDALFCRRWRLQDGWLPADEVKRSLRILYDPLAMEMRRAFAARYLPHHRFLSK